MNLLSNITTVLFDLDGTLLPVKQEEFVQFYFQALSKEFRDLAEPEEFIEGIWAATKQMISNQEPRFNQEVFMEAFFSYFPVEDEEAIINRFDRFYQEQFPHLEKKLTCEQNGAKEVINLFRSRDYSLILATNPIFPREAVEARLKWINVTGEQFELLTSYENMCYSKPNLDYYQEIIKKVEVAPENCLMVGNDPQEDLVANKLGMKTVLITDFLIDRAEKVSFQPDWQGSWQEFRNLTAENL